MSTRRAGRCSWWTTGWRRTTRPSLSPSEHLTTPSWASRAQPAWRSWTPEEVGQLGTWIWTQSGWGGGPGGPVWSGGLMVSLPLAGRCSHQDLQPGGAGRKAPPPPTQGAEPVAEIEAELLWEVPPPHPPRGDVPDRRPLPQDQAQQDHQTGDTGVTGSRLVMVSPCWKNS